MPRIHNPETEGLGEQPMGTGLLMGMGGAADTALLSKAENGLLSPGCVLDKAEAGAQVRLPGNVLD